MKTVAWTGTTAKLVDRPAREPGPGEALVRVELAGVCRTDVAAARGLLTVEQGRVLGHELCGRVEAVGHAEDTRWVGRRVSVDPAFGPGVFLGLQHDGAFAETLVVPAGNLVPVPEGPMMDTTSPLRISVLMSFSTTVLP